MRKNVESPALHRTWHGCPCPSASVAGIGASFPCAIAFHIYSVVSSLLQTPGVERSETVPGIFLAVDKSTLRC